MGRGEWKPSENERIKRAEREIEKKPVSVEKVLICVKECMKKNNIHGDAKIIEPLKENLKEIRKKYGERDIIWIEFAEDFPIVVGAGIGDIGSVKDNLNKKILERLKLQRRTDKMIVVVDIEVNGIGKKPKCSILACRNGVETCIGNYLAEECNVPILNYYSHKNYTDKYWEKVKANNYVV